MFNQDNAIGVEDAAKIIGCTPQYVRQMLVSKACPFIKVLRVGRVWILDKYEVTKFAKER